MTQTTWTIEYTRRNGQSFRQGRYADKWMADMNAGLADQLAQTPIAESPLNIVSAVVVEY